MPRDSIRTLVMSAEKDAVKRFISHMHQSWDQLQVETSQVCSESKTKGVFVSLFIKLIMLVVFPAVLFYCAVLILSDSTVCHSP